MTLDRGMLALLGGGLIGYVGLRVAVVALPWFVLTSTGSAAATGLVVACEMTPYVLAKALSGPLIDRIGQRRVSIAADVLGAVTMGLVPLLHRLELLSLPTLLVLVAVAGGVRGPGDNAKHTSVPLVAARSGAPLQRITGLFAAIERGSLLIGPGIAAVAISLVGAAGALSATAVGFAVSALVWLWVMPIDLEPRAPATRASRGAYGTELVEGVRFLLSERLLLSLVVMILVTNLLDMARVSVLLPVWAADRPYGVVGIGVLLTCFAGPALATSLLASWLGHRLPRRPTYFLAFLLAGPPPFVALAVDLPLWAVGLICAVSGFGAGFLNPMLGAMLFERIPTHLLGRVGGLTDAVAWAGIPFGGLVAAGLVTGIGLSPALLVCAAAYLAATLIPLITVRGSFDAPPPEDPDHLDRDAGSSRDSESRC